MLDQCCNIIMGSLYDEDDPIKLDYLKTIIQIASLNSPKYQILVHFLDNTKTFYGITTVSNINHPKADDDSWRYTPITPLLDTNQRNSAEYSKREIFWRAYYILQDLEVHYPARLPVLAKLAVCDTNAAEILRYIIFNLGFPKDPKSLHSYSVDNVITHPPHSYGHRTRRFTNLYPSGQNNETLLADTCRKNNFPHKQTIFYYPDFNLEYYSGVPFKTIAPTPSTHTTVRGNVTTLSDLLFSLHYSPENTYVVPPERILHVCYRIDLAGGHVDSSAGRTELTQDQIARICEIIDSI